MPTGAAPGPAIAQSGPFIIDSSDRFIYVSLFTYRKKELDVATNRKKLILLGVGDVNYASEWRISHDGEIETPIGSGTDRFQRANRPKGHQMGNRTCRKWCAGESFSLFAEPN